MCKEAENRHQKKWGKNRKSHILLLVMSGSSGLMSQMGVQNLSPTETKGEETYLGFSLGPAV